jgi:hypothetical protein
MQLHRHQRPLLLAVNDTLDIQRIQQPLKLLEIGLLSGGPQIHHKNLTGHLIHLMWINISKNNNFLAIFIASLFT